MIPISDTEECVQASIDNDAAWHSSYDSELSILISSINQLLNNNSDDSLYTLCTFLTEPDIIKTFNRIPEIAHCLVAVNITAEEFNNNLKTTLYLKISGEKNYVVLACNHCPPLLERLGFILENRLPRRAGQV